MSAHMPERPLCPERPLSSERPLCYVCCTNPSPEWRWIGGTVEARLRAMMTGPTVIRDKEAVFLQLQGEPVLVMTVPAPFPTAELRDDSAQRAAWPGLHAASAGWRSHFIISAMDSSSHLSERRTAVENTTMVAAAIVGVARGDAVGWGPTGLFYDAATFVDRVALDPLSVDNLIGCEWTSAEGPAGLSFGARTQGLGVFGLPDIVHAPSEEDRRLIHRRLMSIAAHVIARGPVFRPGETIGPDAQTQAHIETVRDPMGDPLLMVTPAHHGASA